MTDKTKLGIPFFDERFGGIYQKRPSLCIGRQGSGKTIAALQAVLQSARQGERGILLSGWRASDLTIIANNMGLPLTEAIEQGQVTLLEYAHIMPLPEFEQNRTLPPGSFTEFQDIIETGGISRVVIDNILPWVAIPQEDRLVKHIYSFVHAIGRMGVTPILTIPRPVSPLAHTLKNLLVQQIPVVFTLDRDDTGKHTLQLNKYLGQSTLPPPIPFIITRGAGLLRAPKQIPEDVPAPATRARPAPSPIRFSSAIHT
ncbi:MAG: RAD55 family ATPase [Kiritimatiellae bacterium]|nr:RAD55 family ATPase [Kiritimatiellia bacterium]